MATEHESPDPENAGSTRPGVQGWLFDRPPQTPECEAMKPPRRLGKGLAALVDLHTGSESTPATDGQNDEIGSSVLNLLSTTAEELEDSKRAMAMAAAAVSAPPAPPARPVAQAEPQPVAAEPVQEQAPIVAAPIVAVQGGDESEGDEPSEEEDDFFSASEDDTSPVDVPVEEPEAPTSEPVARPREEDAPETIVEAAPTPQPEPEPEPEPVASAFEDEWFDPPIAAFSPAGGFQRVVPAASAAPEPVPEPPRVRETAPPPVSRLPVEPEPAPRSPPAVLAPPAVSRLPDPEPAPEPIPEPAVAAPAPILDDPVIDDSPFFLDDVIVGSFLPDVDLDA